MANERSEDDPTERRGAPSRAPSRAAPSDDGAIQNVAELARRLLACRAVAIAISGDAAAGTIAADPADELPSSVADDPRALADPLAADDLGLGFYVGVPLVDDRGRHRGTLAAVDGKVRRLRAEELESLKLAAHVAAVLLEKRPPAST